METLLTHKVSIVLPPKMEITDTKYEIRDAAHDLIMRYGVRSVSMDDIAAHLGMSKKTIYQYYNDKDALVEAIMLNRIECSQANCVSSLRESDNALHEILEAKKYFSELSKTVSPAIVFDLQKYHKKAFLVLKDFKEKFLLKTIAENIERGKREGLYRQEIDTKTITLFRIQSMFVAFDPAFIQATGQEFYVVNDAIMEHFIYGLVTPKGYEKWQQYLNEG